MKFSRRRTVSPFSLGWQGQDWLYPAPCLSLANAAASANAAHAASGVETALFVAESGFPAHVNVGGINCIMLGATSAFANQDQTCRIDAAAQFQAAKLPADIVLEEHRRMHWWSWRQRLFGAAPGAQKLFCGAHLRTNRTGTGSWGANTFPTIGHGVGLSLDGAGAWQLVRKVDPAANAGASEELVLTWPRTLFDWTEVWFVILGATATKQARFRLYIDAALKAERAWPDDGETGSSNPILNEAFGGTAFMWTARCGGLTFPGTRLLFAGWRYRQGFYDVNGAELNGL